MYEIQSMLGKQFTLAIFKPELVENSSNFTKALSIVRRNGFIFAVSRKFQFTRKEAEIFYSVHEGKYFHERLMQSTSRGPVVCSTLFREDAIRKWRDLIGPTDVEKARVEQPNCLRAQFGITETKNCFHGSDSMESAERERKLIFPNFDPEVWRIHFDRLEKNDGVGSIMFDESDCVHKLPNL